MEEDMKYKPQQFASLCIKSQRYIFEVITFIWHNVMLSFFII